MNTLESILEQAQLAWRLLLDRRTPLIAKVVFVVPFLYLISPIDFIPDFILGLGQLDDLGLIILGFKMIEMMSPAGLVAEHRDAIRGRSSAGTNAASQDVIDGSYRVVNGKEKRKNG